MSDSFDDIRKKLAELQAGTYIFEDHKTNRRDDLVQLFKDGKIEIDEYKRLRSMIDSPDTQDYWLAWEIIKAKFKLEKKKYG